MQAEITCCVGSRRNARRTDAGRMMVFHSSWNMVKQIGRDEENVKDLAATVQSNERQLIGQTYRKWDVVSQRKAKEESGGEEGETIAAKRDERRSGIRGYIWEGGEEKEGEIV